MNISLDNKSTVFPTDSVLFKEGEIAHGLYLIRSGRVVCLKESNGRLYPVYVAGAQDVIGEEFTGHTMTNFYSAIVLEEAELIFIDAATVTNLMEHAPIWTKKLLETLSSRLHETYDLITNNRAIDPNLSQLLNFDQTEVQFKKLLHGKS